MSKIKEDSPGYDLDRRIVVSVVLFRAQVKMLDGLAKETGRSKSELIREAVTVLINTYQGIR